MVSRSINLKLICTSEFFQKPETAIAVNFSYKGYVILALQVPSFSPLFLAFKVSFGLYWKK